jgi:hypothetical protein
MADVSDVSEWRQWVETIGDLKQWLAEHPDLPDDTPIVVEKASNMYSPLNVIYVGWYTPTSPHYGDIHHADYAVTADEAEADPDAAEGVEHGQLYQVREGDTRCLIVGAQV